LGLSGPEFAFREYATLEALEKITDGQGVSCGPAMAAGDGIVLRVSQEGKTAEVVVKGYSGHEQVVLFEGVQAVEMNQPEGMLLYSLCEMRAQPPQRKFVFANNEEDHPGYLSILATDFSVRSD
jgi:hypothetical protein